MGFLRWLKKEIDVKKRRDSAPPLSSYYDPNRDREEYIKQFKKFNKFRAIQHQELQKAKEKEQLFQNISNLGTENDDDDDAIFGSYNDITDDEKYKHHLDGNMNCQNNEINEENFTNINRHNTSYDDDSSLVSEEIYQKNRQSLPANMSRSYITRSFQRNAKKNVINNNNIIYEDEIEEFEANHCKNDSQNPDLDTTYHIISPPSKFFKDNSNPYPQHDNTLTTDLDETTKSKVKYATPNKLTLKGNESHQHSCTKTTTYAKNSSKKHMLDSSSSIVSGSYRNYDINSSSFSDENVVPSKSYKGKKQKSPNRRRCSPPYETIVNKHGDRVEYALPYSEIDTDEMQDDHTSQNKKTNKSLIENQSLLDSFQCAQIVTDSYNFLNNIDTDIHNNTDSGISFLGQNRSNVVVTDLDKSMDSSKTPDKNTINAKNMERDEIFTTLSQLETFSQNVKPHENNFIYMDKNSIIICQPKEIKNKTSVMRSTFSTPLEFSSGVFRKTIVTVRKCISRSTECSQLSEIAIQRDYEILSQIRHTNIMLLMAACFNKQLIRHMSLVLEPTDYTLNYFLYQMNEKLSLFKSISVIQQIASATQYLHECGFIHSNISSHCILMRKHPWCVKLSSFELTTNVFTKNIRNEIEKSYGSTVHKFPCENSKTQCRNSIITQDNDATLHTKYKKMSKLSPVLKCVPNRFHSYIDVPTQFWPYNLEYRRHLSLHYYQAPELQISAQKYVFPTTAADVYSLTILLWEILNNCVPFIIYSQDELELLHNNKQSVLPIFDNERCGLFMKIFDLGLEIDPAKRCIGLQHIVSLLEEIKFAINSSDDVVVKTQTESSDCEYESVDNNIRRVETFKSKISQKILGKYKQGLENELNIYENTSKEYTKTTKKNANTIDKPLPPIPTSPNGSMSNNKLNNSSFNITNMTLYQSLLDFNKCLPNKDANSVAYERTSTLKKRRKPTARNVGKKSTRELFEVTNDTFKTDTEDTFSKLNENLDAIPHSIKQCTDNGDLSNIIGPVVVKESELPTKIIINNQKQKFLNGLLDDKTHSIPRSDVQVVGWKVKDTKKLENSKSVDNLLETPTFSAETKQRFHKALINSEPSSYRFSIGDFSMPHTPIARKNKIRRNAWLSDQYMQTPENLKTDIKPNVNKITEESISSNINNSSQCNNKSIDNTESNQNKKINISIKIVRNKITPPKVDPIKAYDELESPSILSKIQFWNTEDLQECEKIESKPLFYDSSELVTPTKVLNTSELTQNEKNSKAFKDLTQQINDLSTEISYCLSSNKFDSIYPEFKKKIVTALNDGSRDENIKCKSVKETNYAKTGERAEILIKPKTNSSNDTENIFNEIFSKQKANRLSENGHFQNHQWKREKEICDQSKTESLLNDDEPKVITPKWVSVKDTIMQFENRDNLNKTPDVSIKSKNTPTQTNSKDHNDSLGFQNPRTEHLFDASCNMKHRAGNQTLIKRTIYRESIVSGVDLPNLDNVFDNSSGGKKMTTLVTLNMRKLRRRSSDSGKDKMNFTPKLNTRHSICDNGIGLMNQNAGTLSTAIACNNYRGLNSLTEKSNTGKYICCNCATKMSAAEMRALTYDQSFNPALSDVSYGNSIANVNISNTNSSVRLIDGSRTRGRRCQTNPNYHSIRSTEDLYIDDDYTQGLGANMELVADTSNLFDSYDFDIVSTEVVQTENQNNTKN